VTAEGPSNGQRPPRPPPVADEEWSDAYAEGYGEGLREALREMLQHASRGHTAQELRLLIESRLARIREDVELKRKGLLGPPRRPSYGPLFRTAPAAPSPAPREAAPRPIESVERGVSYLVLEERPARAVELLRSAAGKFPRVVVVTFHAPDLAGIEPSKVTRIPVAVRGVVGAVADDALGPQEIAGRIRTATEAEGGALVYIDALEVMASGGATELLVRFVQWVADQVARNRSALIVSLGPNSFGDPVKSLLQRAFNKVL